MAGRRVKTTGRSDVDRAVWGPRTVGDHLRFHGWIEDAVIAASGAESVRWHLPRDATLRTTSEAWEYTMVNMLGAVAYSGAPAEVSYRTEWDIRSLDVSPE